MDAPGAALADAGDLGPEGVTFISALDSPTGRAMLAVGNEVSGRTTLMSITTTTAGATGETGPAAAPTETLAATGAELSILLNGSAAVMLALGLLARRTWSRRA